MLPVFSFSEIAQVWTVSNTYPLKSLKKKAAADNQTSAEKKLPEKVDDKDKDISVSLLKLQIGHIKKAWKHPSAERYYS